MKKILGYSFLFAMIMIACTSKTKKMEDSTNKKLDQNTKESTTVDQVATQFKEILLEKGFTVMADIDHAAGAKAAGLELRPTRTLIFGNPKGGTLLMQQSQEMGIDLPLKLVIWADASQQVQASYYDGTALTARYGITKPEALIAKINNMFKGVTGAHGKRISQEPLMVKEALITKRSPLDVPSTFANLKQVVLDKGLQIMAEVPHDKGAQKVELELRPTRVLLFGNPKVGTLLMQSNQEIGLDLPLKILVYENEEGETLVSYYDATFLTQRYGIKDKEEVVKKINTALQGITTAAVAYE